MSKPAAPTAASTAASTAATTAASTAAATKAKAPVASPVTAKPVAKPVVKPAAKAAPAPASAKGGSARPGNVKPAAKTAPQNLVPTSAPTPLTNRFTDRFAPAAPASRQLTETADIPKSTHKVDPKLVNAWKTKPGRELTVAELLAMPDAEYMNDKQLDFFRVQLQKQKDDLLSNAGETTEHLREDTSIVPDPADRATIEEEHALELRTRDRERKLLKKIAQSLTRLDSGEYGFCDETGEPIGLQRLLARPTATLSLEAQQRREMKQRMFGD